jgi:hypothetical protein
MAMGIKPTKALLEQVNELNVARAFSRRIVIDGKVLVVRRCRCVRSARVTSTISSAWCSVARASMPRSSGGSAGGSSLTPRTASLPDLERPVHSWREVLQASRTATVREFTAWLDAWAGCDSWIDKDDESVTVVLRQHGEGNEYPFPLADLRDSVERLQAQAEEDEED